MSLKRDLTDFVFLFVCERKSEQPEFSTKKHRSRQYRLKCYSMQASCLKHKIKVRNVYESAKVLTNVQTFRDYTLHQWNVRHETHNEHSTDEGHSPETSKHLSKFWHVHKHSSLLFIVVTSATQPTKLFSFLHICLEHCLRSRRNTSDLRWLKLRKFSSVHSRFHQLSSKHY